MRQPWTVSANSVEKHPGVLAGGVGWGGCLAKASAFVGLGMEGQHSGDRGGMNNV